MPRPFKRPTPPPDSLPSFASQEGGRLERFSPPFRFTRFFSPEDTLLCVLAAESAAGLLRSRGLRDDELRILELTTGSGLVGLAILDRLGGATLLGTDIDEDSPSVATSNAVTLGLNGRARFIRMDLWDRAMESTIASAVPRLLLCNPPYVPEPEAAALPGEAGAGPDGAAHLRRVIQLARATRPDALALSWCSLSDPVGVVRDAERAGYDLAELFVLLIADGEYSGTVHDYLRDLPTAFLSEDAATLQIVAPDGAARFAYLLMAGAFVNRRPPHGFAGSSVFGRDSLSAGSAEGCVTSESVEEIVRRFAVRGVRALAGLSGRKDIRFWILDRWDEIALRVALQ